MGFKRELRFFLEDAVNAGFIAWSNDKQKFFFLKSDEEVEKSELISKYFKHNSMKSFVRQLHNYGFNKSDGPAGFPAFTSSAYRKYGDTLYEVIQKTSVLNRKRKREVVDSILESSKREHLSYVEFKDFNFYAMSDDAFLQFLGDVTVSHVDMPLILRFNDSVLLLSRLKKIVDEFNAQRNYISNITEKILIILRESQLNAVEESLFESQDIERSSLRRMQSAESSSPDSTKSSSVSRFSPMVLISTEHELERTTTDFLSEFHSDLLKSLAEAKLESISSPELSIFLHLLQTENLFSRLSVTQCFNLLVVLLDPSRKEILQQLPVSILISFFTQIIHGVRDEDIFSVLSFKETVDFLENVINLAKLYHVCIPLDDLLNHALFKIKVATLSANSLVQLLFLLDSHNLLGTLSISLHADILLRLNKCRDCIDKTLVKISSLESWIECRTPQDVVVATAAPVTLESQNNRHSLFARVQNGAAKFSDSPLDKISGNPYTQLG